MVRTWRNAPTVRASMYTQHIISAQEHQKWWDAQSGRQDRVHLIHLHNNNPLGYISLTDITLQHKRCSWGLYTAPDAPKGTGFAMCAEAILFAYANIGVHKICCEALGNNTRAIHLYKKLGFQEEGILRDHVWLNGTKQDVIVMGLLKGEQTL